MKSKERALCEDYCRQFPDMKKLTLARKIFDENKTAFPKLKNVEHVRRAYVNVIRGAHGALVRQKTKDKSLYQPLTHDTTNSKPYKNTNAKILILDIETAPIRAFVWGLWNQNITIDKIISDWFCLTWAAKWLFDKKVYSAAVTPAEAIAQNDKRIMRGLWALMNEADIIIAHNGDKFDIPKINTRFLLNGFEAPLPYQTIDTLKHIRRQFGMSSNKLDYVNKLLNLERKQETGGFELWAGCYKGDQKSLNKMLKYNCGDVKILEETYLRIRGWIRPHPSVALHILDENQSHCPTCGSSNLIDEKKGYHTSVNVYEMLRCADCGAVSRKRLSVVTVDHKKRLIISTAK